MFVCGFKICSILSNENCCRVSVMIRSGTANSLKMITLIPRRVDTRVNIKILNSNFSIFYYIQKTFFRNVILYYYQARIKLFYSLGFY